MWQTAGKLLLGLVLLGAWADASDPTPVKSVVVSLIADVDVASEEAGLLTELNYREGDTVDRGQVLARLDSHDAQLEVERQQATLRIAQSEAENDLAVQLAEKALAVADAELRRAEESNEKFDTAVSQTEIDKLRFLRDQAQLQIQEARHQQQLAVLQVELREAELAIAENNLRHRQILAPLTGVIVRSHRQHGEWIQPGETLCRIIRTDRVRAEGFVSIEDPPIRTGQRVELVWTPADTPPRHFEGQIVFVDPEVNPVTGQFRIWAEVENPEGILRPGLRPEMRILPGHSATTSSQP